MKGVFQTLWDGYTRLTPSAKVIHDLFESNGDTIVNDHIAIRTFNDSRVDIAKMAEPFISLGYVEAGTYEFPAKKLFAKHFHIPGNSNAPKVFISELKLELMSDSLRRSVSLILDSVDPADLEDPNLVLTGRPWSKPSHQLYEKLREESEYAAWMYLYGFCANHFTVNVNELKGFESLEAVNDALEAEGFTLNASGGKIKGSKEQGLEQSSILADLQDFDFVEGVYKVPTCYYEFAMRHELNGELFDGFIAGSADKIFESTDLKLQTKLS